jgi:hypothetical protein
LLGLADLRPKHAGRFLEGSDLLRDAFCRYRDAVESGAFPTAAESHLLDEHAVRRIERMASYSFPASMQHEGIDLEAVLAESEAEG